MLRTHTPETRHPQISTVTAFDLLDGARLSDLDVRDVRAAAETATVAAGMLVMLSVVGGPPVIVVR